MLNNRKNLQLTKYSEKHHIFVRNIWHWGKAQTYSTHVLCIQSHKFFYSVRQSPATGCFLDNATYSASSDGGEKKSTQNPQIIDLPLSKITPIYNPKQTFSGTKSLTQVSACWSYQSWLHQTPSLPCHLQLNRIMLPPN